jgi:hypothetical protein
VPGPALQVGVEGVRHDRLLVPGQLLLPPGSGGGPGSTGKSPETDVTIFKCVKNGLKNWRSSPFTANLGPKMIIGFQKKAIMFGHHW